MAQNFVTKKYHAVKTQSL